MRSLGVSRAGVILAPTGYKPSEGFEEHGASVGRIFLSSMKRLEARTGLPFVTQFGFPKWTEVCSASRSRLTIGGSSTGQDGRS